MGDNAPQLPQRLSTLGGGARLQRIDALAARMARLDAGPVRAVLEERLRRLLEDVPQPDAGPARPTHAVPANGLAALAGLLAQLRTRGTPAATAAADPSDATESTAPRPSEGRDGFAPLPALDAARQAWARLRLEARLRDAIAALPADAGPMHSTVLVHRAIAVMREAAPGYLLHFLGHADALAALERHCRTPRSRLPAAAADPRSRSRRRRRPG